MPDRPPPLHAQRIGPMPPTQRDSASNISLLVLGLMLTIPFLSPYHYFPITTFYTEWLALALGTAAMFPLALAKRGEPGRIPHVTAGLAGFALVLALQIALGRIAYPERSFIGMLYALWAGLLVWLGMRLRERCGAQRVGLYLQAFLAAGGFLVAMSGFVQYYGLVTVLGHFVDTEPSVTHGMFGTIAQRNNFANYLACGLASLIFLVGQRRIRFSAAALPAIPLMLALALSASRSAWVFVILIQMAVFWVFRTGDRERRRPLMSFSLFTLVLFIYFHLIADNTAWLAGPAGAPITGGERWAETFALGQAEWKHEIRSYLFGQAWSIFETRPLLGVGFGEFGWNFFLQATPFNGVQTVVDRNSHNIVLQLLAETGVVGALFIVAPLIFWLLRFPWREATPQRGWLIAILAIEGAHSMVEFPLWHANFLGVAALLVGFGAPASFRLEFSRLRQAAVAVILVAGGLALTRILFDYRGFERWYFEIEAAGRARMPLSAKQLSRLTELGDASLFASYYDLLGAELIEPNRDDLDAKLALNAQAMRFFPIPSAVFRHGLLLHLKGDRDGALAILRRMAIMYPAQMPGFLDKLDRLAKSDPVAFGDLARDARRSFARRQ